MVLGPRAGNSYIVKEGLQEGDLVVAHGNFKIDSAIQILAKPSMMNPQGGGPPPGHHHGPGAQPGSPPEMKRFEAPTAFQAQLTLIFQAYQKLQGAFSGDDLELSKQSAGEVREAISKTDMKLLAGEAHQQWMSQVEPLRSAAVKIGQATSIEKARAAFETLSEELTAAIRSFGLAAEQPVYLLRCPMAFSNRGANWLQGSPEVRNPYFGERMLRCGKVVETLTDGQPEPPVEHQHGQ